MVRLHLKRCGFGSDQPASVRDPRQSNPVLRDVQIRTRDALGRARSIDHAPNINATVTYDSTAKSVRTVGPTGQQRTLTYDSAGLPRTDDVTGVSTKTYTFDNEGRLASVSDVTSSGADLGGSFTYDDLNHVRQVRDADARLQVEYTSRYDGATTAVAVPEGTKMLTTTTPRTVLGEVRQVAEPSGHTVDYEYDAHRRLAAETPAGTPGRRYTYDLHDTLTRVTSRDGTFIEATHFDPDVHLPTQVTLPSGAGQIGATYDGLGRLETRTTTYQLMAPETETVTYDGLDRVRTLDGPAGLQTMDYDTLGVQTHRSFDPAVGPPLAWRVNPRADGAVAQRHYPSGLVVDHQRDSTGRLDGLTIGTTPLVTVDSYATHTRPGTVRLGTSQQLQRIDVYDARQRLRTRRYVHGAQTLAELRYAYDPADREVARQALHRGGRTDLFSYDDDGRLLHAELGARLQGTAPVAGPWTVTQAPRAVGAWLPGDYARCPAAARPARRAPGDHHRHK